MQNDVDFGLIIRISGQKTALKRAYYHWYSVSSSLLGSDCGEPASNCGCVFSR